ncbi:unnamed protein product [Protopolystoma xenopodis]|uniref:Uncharacterized protein n=1 Tax=Protopolystoma xenopodis TaxID=117903 RepID=A0A3S5AIF8_9PLAT|nr:unnamed protein product [Protopolystoma xenopodis]
MNSLRPRPAANLMPGRCEHLPPASYRASMSVEQTNRQPVMQTESAELTSREEESAVLVSSRASATSTEWHHAGLPRTKVRLTKLLLCSAKARTVNPDEKGSWTKVAFYSLLCGIGLLLTSPCLEGVRLEARDVFFVSVSHFGGLTNEIIDTINKHSGRVVRATRIDFTCLFDEFVTWCREWQHSMMIPTTMPAKSLRMYQVHCLMLGIMTTTMSDNFGLGAFY